MKTEISVETLKATPPITVTTAALMAPWTLNDAVLVATLVYVVLQAGYLIWKWRKESGK